MTKRSKLIGMAALTALVVLVLGSSLMAEEMGKAGEKMQTQCPISGKAINKDVYVDQDGKRVYFCCPGCPPEFKKDPGKYMKDFEMQGVTLEDAPATGAKPADPAKSTS